MSVIFDQVTGDVQDGRRSPEGAGPGPAAPGGPAPSDEGQRAKTRAELRLISRREARVRAT